MIGRSRNVPSPLGGAVTVKLLCGVVLLCLSLIWVVLWCAQLSDPLSTDFNAVYRVIFVLVASLAFIPVFWAASLLDGAGRAHHVSATAPFALPEAKTKSESPKSSIWIWTLAAHEMRQVAMIVAILLASINSVGAQSNRGPAYPTEAQRGQAFSKHVSPSATNPTNWVARPPIPEPEPQPRWWRRAYRRNQYYLRHR